MGVHLDGSTIVGVSRLDVIEGPSWQRQRTKAERARIGAESTMPGVTLADVARRHDTVILPKTKGMRMGVDDVTAPRRHQCAKVMGWMPPSLPDGIEMGV
jgi:hypothetical protein